METKKGQKAKKAFPWKILFFAVCGLLIAGAVVTFLIFDHNNNVLNSYIGLNEKSKKTIQTQEGIITDKEDQLTDLNEKNEDLKEILIQTESNLETEKQLTSKLLCPVESASLRGIEFDYGGNASMHRALKNFTEQHANRVYTDKKNIIGAEWNYIWSNVDVAMHKITITGNIRYYFITSYNDAEFDYKDSIYWINWGCFLDYP